MNPQYLDTYYNPDWVYENIKTYFGVHEMFTSAMCAKFSEDALWSFLDYRVLSNLLFIRTSRDNSITVNGNGMEQRGFRDNLTDIVKSKTTAGKLYASAHVTGNGVDFTEKNIIAEDTRDWIEANANDLPFKCRLEWRKNGVPITWVHMDCNYYPNHPKVYKFDV